MFRLASLVAILSTAMTTVDTAAGVYNYDKTHVWDQVEPLATNECGGSKNSPIAVDDMACTDYHNYVMVVSSKRSTFEYERDYETEREGGF